MSFTYLLLPTKGHNKNKNKTRESEIKRNKTIIDHTQKIIMLFSVGVNVNQYGCFLSLNAIRDLFDNINEAMLSNFFHSFSNRPFQNALSNKTGICKAKRKLFCFSELLKRVDVVRFIILLKFALLMEGVWITWITLQGRNKLALHIFI